MRKFLRQSWIIIKLAWQKNLNYRFTVFMYRIGEIIEVLVLIVMWTAIYSGGGGMIKGFTLSEMVTYVLIGNLFSVAVRNFLPDHVSREIEHGRLSAFLVKPVSYIRFTFTNELGRIFLATILSVLSQVIVILFFLDRVIFNTDMSYILVIVSMVFFAFIIELLLGFLIGSIAFWTDEVAGLQASIDRVKRFFSGGYFPLSLLPVSLSSASGYLPFGYSFFVPASLYLKKIDLAQGLRGLMIQAIWIVLLSLILGFVWKRGLRKFEATGS